jgi:hypothetical protein
VAKSTDATRVSAKDLTEKQCNDCNEVKPAADFYRLKSGYLYSRCKACHYIRTEENRAKRKDHYRELERKRYHAGGKVRKRWEKIRAKYGLTREDYDLLVAAQGGVCAICLEPFPADDITVPGDWDAPAVDHCHETGVVRGILHRRCNLAIEFLLTDEQAARARDYLKQSVSATTP